MPLLSWPVWQWGRLFLLTAASTLALYILLDDDLVMTSWEINDFWDTVGVIKGGQTTSCRKIHVDIIIDGVSQDIEADYCLDEEQRDLWYNEPLQPIASERSGTYKCEDSIGDPVLTSLYDGVDVQMLLKFDFSQILLFFYADGDCCERLQGARVRLIAGCSFTVAAMVAAGLTIFYSQKSTSTINVTGNWIYLIYICFVFSAVATGLFGSALELSDTNGIWTCNHKFEQNILNYRATTNTLAEETFSETDAKESREMGFWLLMALVVTLGGHLLIELVVFGATFLKNFKKGAAGSSSSNKIQEFTAKLLF